jgi:hypothetical protein
MTNSISVNKANEKNSTSFGYLIALAKILDTISVTDYLMKKYGATHFKI